MVDIISVTGFIATDIKHTVTNEGLDVSQFRLASNNRRFDAATKRWVDGETNWFTVVAFRQLAANAKASLGKGHRVVVAGRLRVRDWQEGEKKGTNVEIVADAIGPDLAWGKATYERTPRALAAVPTDAAAAEAGEPPAEEVQFPTEAQEPVAVPF
jgi:single-strand DNA-binding protein